MHTWARTWRSRHGADDDDELRYVSDYLVKAREFVGTGDAGWTTADDLPAKWIIHTVGPNHSAGETDRALPESGYRRSLQDHPARQLLAHARPAQPPVHVFRCEQTVNSRKCRSGQTDPLAQRCHRHRDVLGRAREC